MLATRSMNPFRRDIDPRSACLVGLRLMVVVAMVAASLFVVPRSAQATLFSCDEIGLEAALSEPGGPHTFDCSEATTITTSSTKTVAASVILDGAGDLTISGAGTHGVFVVDAGFTLELQNITIADGNAFRGGAIYVSTGAAAAVVTDSSFVNNHAEIQGGAVWVGNDGALLDIAGSTVDANTSGAYGGGIHVEPYGVLTMSDTTVSGNTATAESGGGLYALGATTIEGSTISGNTAAESGGGFSGVASTSELTIRNSTISGNTAARAGGAKLGGTVRLSHATISDNTATTEIGGALVTGTTGAFPREFTGVLIAGNTAPTDAECYFYPTVSSLGSNLIGDGTNCPMTSDPSDLIGTPGTPIDPLLVPLANNGGPTMTHALLAASPAYRSRPRRHLCTIG